MQNDIKKKLKLSMYKYYFISSDQYANIKNYNK